MKEKLFISETEKQALANYLEGELNKSDTLILNAWLNKSKQNKLLFDQFTDIWQASQYAKISKNIDAHSAWKELQEQLRKDSKNPFQWKRWLQIAAIVIISLLAGGLGNYFLNKPQTKIPENQSVEYFAPLGSRSFVKMPDGSRIWLNSGTTIQYNNSFGTDNRNIKLLGEAFFEVAKNKKLPFIVKTSEINITALGTKFNVKAYPEEKTIETTLIEGSVKLKSTTVNLNQNIVLKPNEKAVFTKKNQALELITQNKNKKVLDTTTKPKLEIIESVEPEPIISWKDKRWVIRNEKLGDLAVKLERRYDVNFIFDNDLLKEYSFGGTLEDESLEQVMKAIQFSSPINYIIDDKTVYIMADGKKVEKFKDLLMK